MPRGVAAHPQSYRIALTLSLVVALVAAIFGALPIAILVAAFAVPIVYVVYLYDVNLWEDEPLPVTGLAFGLTGVLTIIFMVIVELVKGPSITTATFDGVTLAAPTVGTFLLLALVVPVVGEAIRQVGPLILASRPMFDDLMDGLTFGVISGVSFACFDTIVRYWDLLTGGIVERDPGLWVSLIFLHGFVKPLLIGTATGIACAEYSGLGRGYDGFTPRYFQALALAVGANIAFQAGAYLFGFVGDDTLGVVLSLGWGLLILAVLILRMRAVLHVGLMEAALERTARAGGIGSDGDLDICARCELPLMQRAAFCNACGTAVRIQDKAHRVKSPTPARAAAPGWSTDEQPGAGWPPAEGSASASNQTEDTVALDPSGGPATKKSPPASTPPAEEPPAAGEASPRRADGDEQEGGRA